MNQRVMVIHSRSDYACDDTPFPPVGVIGELVSGIDEYDEYDVMFDGYPHPSADPSWITHKSMIVFIDPEKVEQREEELCLTF